MRIIGLTGPSGSGKGAVGAMLEDVGIPSIDTDKVYHDLLVPPSACVDELVGAFGDKILDTNGLVDRKILAKLVFSDKTGALQEQLNVITHKYVIDKTWALLAEYRAMGKRAAVIDAPLLIEAGIHTKCDLSICVLADRDIRKARIMARDGITEEAALMRISAQKADEFYCASTKYTLYNNSTLDALRASLYDILRAEDLALEI